ncbi:hypothetical protein [Mycobacterium sp. D16R24]|uniref:hypothetical protein n=1 Tax=Mycobacterium sp. D16R24 TaxID=1855656 RepID=UPI000991CCD9|nr:hypothetical protein [Mycobacterium sp. D16R24]
MSRMVAWLSNTTTLSNLGDLEQEDFLLLARRAATVQGTEYDDARYQFAASGIRDLIDVSWTSVEEEHHKIGCLQCLSEYVGDETLLREYLDKAADLPGRYLRDCAEHLRASLP